MMKFITIAPVADQGEAGGGRNWRGNQADHHDRMAKLSDAYAAAYEGDVQFATSAGQRAYLTRRAQGHRKDAQRRRDTAHALRSAART